MNKLVLFSNLQDRDDLASMKIVIRKMVTAWKAIQIYKHHAAYVSDWTHLVGRAWRRRWQQKRAWREAAEWAGRSAALRSALLSRSGPRRRWTRLACRPTRSRVAAVAPEPELLTQQHLCYYCWHFMYLEFGLLASLIKWITFLDNSYINLFSRPLPRSMDDSVTFF